MNTATARAEKIWTTPRTLDDDLLDDFAADQRARNLSPQTVRTYRSILDTLRADVGSLMTATPRQLRLFQGRDGITAGTRRVNRAVIVALYRFARLEGYRDDDPSERLAAVKVPRAEPRPFTAPPTMERPPPFWTWCRIQNGIFQRM